MKEKIIVLIKNRIKDLEERMGENIPDKLLLEYKMRSLELIWLLEDISNIKD